MTREVLLERDDSGVATLTLNRPDRLNALTLDMIYEHIGAALAEVASDDSVGALVLTGAGRGFCAGADLESGAFEVGDGLAAHMERSHRAPLALRDLPKPTLAAINGPAVGAGLGLALACDVRLAAPSAKFIAPFARMAMTPDFGLTWSLQRIVGHARAAQLLLDGTAIDAPTALSWGLVSTIEDNVVDAALVVARRWAQAPVASGLIKKSLVAAQRSTFSETLFDIEPAAQIEAMGSAEFADRFAEYRAGIGRR